MSLERKRSKRADELDALLRQVRSGDPANTRGAKLKAISDESQLIEQTRFSYVLDANDKPKFQFFTSSFGPGSHLP